MSREEYEVPCTAQEFKQNKSRLIGNYIEKIRYVVPYGELNLEIDIFTGDLKGLCICEIEFESVEQSISFNPPTFCLIEVTKDKNYKNQSLAINGIPDYNYKMQKEY